MTKQELLEAVSKQLADDGRLIEAGWFSLRALWMPDDAPDFQIDEMRMAFMAGAQHLFSSIMTILEPGEDPTGADLTRMDLIHKELTAFREELELRLQRPRGSG